MTLPGHTYVASLPVNSVDKLELRVVGNQVTFVKTICFGYFEQRQRRVVCVNSNLLRTCQQYLGNHGAINCAYQDMLFSQTRMGMQRIVVRNVGAFFYDLIRTFTGSSDPHITKRICESIQLQQGSGDSGSDIGCPAITQNCSFGTCVDSNLKNIDVRKCQMFE